MPKIPLIEMLKDRVYLGAFDHTPQDSAALAYFTIDDELPYNAFHHDFGPLHMGHLYRFAVALHEVMADDINDGKAVVLYSRTDPRSRANAACVLCCYMVLIQAWPPHLALAPIAQAEPPVMPFRDAGYAPADFTLSIQDVVYGVWRAKEHGLLDIKSFNLEDYEKYERVDQGDFNEIPPHFIAFASPQQPSGQSPNHAFRQVLRYFGANDVQLVVRLNSKLYDKSEFERRGIQHLDLEFEDGTCPSMSFVQTFIGAVETVVARQGKVAVHCKAGLGRTGCLIGAHLIYTYGFTAQEVIGYMRFLRPGMVVGPQQHWLYLHQHEFRDWRRSMVVSDVLDRSLGVYPLVPLSSVHSSASSHTPVTPQRGALASRNQSHDTNSLPVPTPGQPRKTPAHDKENGGSKDLAVAPVRSPVRAPSFAPSIARGQNSDDEDYYDDGDYGTQADELDPFSPKRAISDTFRGSLKTRQLRSGSNPNYQMTTTTTTTTVTLSSSPPEPVRKPSRVLSASSRVRKVKK